MITVSCFTFLYQYEYRAEVDHFSIFTLEDNAVTLPKLFHRYSDRINIIVPPRSGVLSNGFSTLIYTPHLNFTGKDTFQYKISRGIFGADIGTVQISVHPVNDEPILKNPYQMIRVFSGESKVFTVGAVDPDDKNLRLHLKNDPIYGELKGAWPNLVYHAFPIANESVETLSFDIVDRMGARSSGTLEITILENTQDKVETAETAENNGENVCLKGIEPFIREGALAVGDFYQYETSPNAFYKPASTIKILTAAVVKNVLKEMEAFKTFLFNDSQGVFYIKGMGDPSLKLKDYRTFIEKILIKGKNGGIKKIVLDTTLFKGRLNYNGRKNVSNYFEAPLSALSIDRNTVNVVKRYGYIYMRNRSYPLTHYLKKQVKRMPDGRQFIPLAKNSSGVHQFLMDFLNKELKKREKENIKVEMGRVPKELTPYYTHQGRESKLESIRYMLKYSNNFVTNQLLLIAASKGGMTEIDLDDGVSLLTTYLHDKVGIDAIEYIISEGSGLSPDTRITLGGMQALLKSYKVEKEDLPFLVESKFEDLRSLPHSRMIRAKTGSLRDVYNIVGYLKRDGAWIPFIVFLNQSENGRAKVMGKMIECMMTST